MASDRPDGVGAVPLAPTDANEQTKAKQKRRRGRREGPPQLQFVIATNPSEFKGQDARRSVRSQAMIHWRHEEEKKQKRVSQKDESALPSSSMGPSPRGAVRSEHVSSIPTRGRQPKFSQDSFESTTSDTLYEQQLHPGSDSLSNNAGSSHCVDMGSSSWQLTATETASYFPHYQTRTQEAVLSRPVTDYEESKTNEERQLWMLVVGLATHYNIGSNLDPFDVLPQFRNPRLSSLYLSRTCMRAFASANTIKKWLPLMLAHPHIILSSNNLASTWLDMHNNCSGDSVTTAMVKAETISMIKERLVDPNLQLDDTTLIVILHLFAGEMWVCNEKTLKIHENGVATFITRRGGLASFANNKALAEVAVCCCQHCDIFCEAEVLPPFRDFSPTSLAPIDSESPVPESPLFCPGRVFRTIATDSQCSQSTLELLSDMRDLTSIFVTHNTALNTIHDIEAVDVACLSAPPEDYEARVYRIRKRLLSLPSASKSGLSISGDWIYEACRIAALIYTTAIAMAVPFSVAADPNRVDVYEDSMSFAGCNSGEFAKKPHLTEALYETLQRTDTSNLWKDMSGVLYWVSAVGAAAARIPSTMNMAQQDRLANDAYSVWVRRCLIMTATRTMIVLVFEHPAAIITAQQRMLKVQDLIGSHASRRLMA